ncbi:MAG: guanylate kinase [bacterium]
MECAKNTKNKSHIFVISGPSGVGKGTLLSMLIKKHPEISLSISVTTRKPRHKETDGVNYFFTAKEIFENLIKEEKLLEWAEFAGNYYGTYLKTVEKALSENKDIALEIDVKGAVQIKEKIKEAVLIFIMPPSMEELQTRLFKRSTESKEIIEKRLAVVTSEIESKKEFDYEIINEDLDEALRNLEAIILAERCRITDTQ